MKKYEYTIKFRSEYNDTKKQAILTKLQETFGPYVQNGTIEATSDAIHVDAVDVGETYPFVTE